MMKKRILVLLLAACLMMNVLPFGAFAEEDLKMRGPGDFFGSRQSGLPAFRVADLSFDLET